MRSHRYLICNCFQIFAFFVKFLIFLLLLLIALFNSFCPRFVDEAYTLKVILSGVFLNTASLTEVGYGAMENCLVPSLVRSIITPTFISLVRIERGPFVGHINAYTTDVHHAILGSAILLDFNFFLNYIINTGFFRFVPKICLACTFLSILWHEISRLLARIFKFNLCLIHSVPSNFNLLLTFLFL